jgi:hypothetical protein
MHAFDFILMLFSFVYAAAVTHVLSTAGEIIIASKHIRLSWFNAGWMLGLLQISGRAGAKKRIRTFSADPVFLWMKGSD